MNGSQLLLVYGKCGDVEGIQSVMTRAGNEVFAAGVMNALVYESVLRVLAPLEAWQDAETLVKVRGVGSEMGKRLQWRDQVHRKQQCLAFDCVRVCVSLSQRRVSR